jgi:hypothetical protein
MVQMPDILSSSENGFADTPKKLGFDEFVEHVEVTGVGRENLADALPPHESYEGRHRWDPSATWTNKEEKRVVRKTDLYLLSWICVMVCMIGVASHSCKIRLIVYQFFSLQLDRGNIQNALTDNLLTDLNLTTNDYNNV